jgi:hypothetical protein
VGIRWCRSMPGLALVRHVPAPYPVRDRVPAGTPPVEPEQVEEVWDAELVGDASTPGWLAAPAAASYLLCGLSAAPRRVDMYA